MPSTDFNDLALLVHVARCATLGAAARATGIPKSTLSRRLGALEARLGVPLLVRGARRLEFTEPGARLVSECGPLLARVEDAAATLTRDGAAARGKLRVSAPREFGGDVVAPLVEAFAQQHPEVAIELVCDDRVLDLVAERFDLAVRIGPLTDPSLVVRAVGTLSGAVVASPGYVARRGMPSTPEDLAIHECLVFTPAPFGPTWTLHHSDGRALEVTVSVRLASNHLAVLRRAARAGLGVARLPEYLYSADCAAGHLVRLLPGWSTGIRKVHVAWPQSRRLAPLQRALIDFLVERLPRAPIVP